MISLIIGGDDRGTPDDTYDDRTKVLFRENSEVVQSIKSGSIAVGDVVMLQPCEDLYLGFNGVFISNEEPDNTRKYSPSEYEVVTFRPADYTDIFAGDVSMSYKISDAENPIAFSYFPSDVEIYSMDKSGRKQETLYKGKNKCGSNKKSGDGSSDSGKENPGDQSKPQEINGAGFQKGALSYMMGDALNIIGGWNSDDGLNIGIKFKDTVLYDEDGSGDTENDQFKFGGNITYKDLKIDAGIEWHPDFNLFPHDLLPQQLMGKYSYTENVNVHADWTGKISLDDYKVDTGETDDKGNPTETVGFVKAANKLLHNDFENNKQFMGMTLSGVDLSNSIVLGAFGVQVVGLSPVVGIKNAQSSSKLAPWNAILVIMPVLDVTGEVSAEVGFAYGYSSYHEKGINLQKKDYVGAYGSLSDNKGQSSIDLGDRSLEVYNVCSKSESELSSDPAWSLTFKGEGEAKMRLAVGADFGLMMAGIMPVSTEVKLYEEAKANLQGQIKADNENGLSVEGSASVDAKLGVMAGAHFKLAISSALSNPEIKKDIERDLVLSEIGLASTSINGTVLKMDTDTDDSNNEKMAGVTVTLKHTDQLGQPEQTATTDGEGNYTFTNTADGKYKLLFHKDGFDDYETDEFEMSGTGKSVNAYLPASTHSVLSGRVTEADADTDTTNNVPLAGVDISVSLVNGAQNIDKQTSTGGDGMYEISDLPIGLYNVTFTKDGYIKTSQLFEIAEGVENYYNTIIEAISNENGGEGTASGVVSDYLTGEGIEGLTLNVRNGTGAKLGPVVSTITSGGNGNYSVGPLPAGTYTVEIIDNRPDVTERYLTNYFNVKILGNMDIGNQNGAVGTGLASDQLRIVLRWGSTPEDLDSHLIGPTSDGGKFHIYFDDETYSEDDVKIADLDLDDTSSWGPETTTIYHPVLGTYKFCVQDYSNRSYEDNTYLASSGAYVQIFRGISTVPEYELYVPQGIGTVWNVFEYDSVSGRINVINTITHQPDEDEVGFSDVW